YFDSQDLSSRKADELPWQLAEVKEWWLLCRALADPRLIGAVWANEEHEAKHYWSCLEGNSFKMIDAYAGILANPSECESDEAVWGLADLLSNAGYLSEELDLLRYLSGVYEKALPSKPARHNVGVLLNRQALNLQHQGLVAEAASFSRECIALYEQEEDSDGLQVALGTHAMILRDISDLPGARQCLVKKERICRDHGLTAGLAAALIDHGLLEVDIGNLSQAMSLFEQAESLCGQRNDRMGLSVIHDNKAQILFLQGNFAEALAHLSLSEEFLDTIGNIYGLQMVLGHKAIILGAQGNTSGALEALERKGQICREHGYVQDLVHSLANQAEVCAKRGRMLKALPLAKEANDIANEHCLRNLQPKIAAIIEEIRSQIN
ncbi:MAG: hypothetical protein WCG94_08375, partial [Methanothrix sp.]